MSDIKQHRVLAFPHNFHSFLAYTWLFQPLQHTLPCLSQHLQHALPCLSRSLSNEQRRMPARALSPACTRPHPPAPARTLVTPWLQVVTEEVQFVARGPDLPEEMFSQRMKMLFMPFDYTVWLAFIGVIFGYTWMLKSIGTVDYYRAKPAAEAGSRWLSIVRAKGNVERMSQHELDRQRTATSATQIAYGNQFLGFHEESAREH